MQTDAQQFPFVKEQLLVFPKHGLLYRNGAVQRVNSVGELSDRTLALRVKAAPIMFGDQVLEDLVTDLIALCSRGPSRVSVSAGTKR
jgi:hypothetical protein